MVYKRDERDSHGHKKSGVFWAKMPFTFSAKIFPNKDILINVKIKQKVVEVWSKASVFFILLLDAFA